MIHQAGAGVPQLDLLIADRHGAALMVDQVAVDPGGGNILLAPFLAPVAGRLIAVLHELRGKALHAASGEEFLRDSRVGPAVKPLARLCCTDRLGWSGWC